jgi:RNA-binding protein 26
MQSKDSPGAASSSGASAPQIAASTSSSGSKKPSGAASALAAKQELLEKQIAEQKTLMASLSTATPEQKKDIMARLRKLNEEMKASSVSAPTPPSISKSTTDSEEAEPKKSDKEGESHANGDAEETTEQLKAKLEKLKAEVSFSRSVPA